MRAGGGASTGRQNVLGHACDSNDGGAGATWSQIDSEMTDYASGVAYCQSQGASLCPRSRYCMQGVGGAPVGGRRGGDQWAPTSDSDNSWVQVRPSCSGVAPHRPLLTVVLRLGRSEPGAAAKKTLACSIMSSMAASTASRRGAPPPTSTAPTRAGCCAAREGAAVRNTNRAHKEKALAHHSRSAIGLPGTHTRHVKARSATTTSRRPSELIRAAEGAALRRCLAGAQLS